MSWNRYILEGILKYARIRLNKHNAPLWLLCICIISYCRSIITLQLNRVHLPGISSNACSAARGLCFMCVVLPIVWKVDGSLKTAASCEPACQVLLKNWVCGLWPYWKHLAVNWQADGSVCHEGYGPQMAQLHLCHNSSLLVLESHLQKIWEKFAWVKNTGNDCSHWSFWY